MGSRTPGEHDAEDIAVGEEGFVDAVGALLPDEDEADG
jgi:hypothetical protein